MGLEFFAYAQGTTPCQSYFVHGKVVDHSVREPILCEIQKRMRVDIQPLNGSSEILFCIKLAKKGPNGLR